MAKYHVLGIGYDYDYYSLATAKWTNYDIEFDFADSFAQAKALLSIKDYLPVATLWCSPIRKTQNTIAALHIWKRILIVPLRVFCKRIFTKWSLP